MTMLGAFPLGSVMLMFLVFLVILAAFRGHGGQQHQFPFIHSAPLIHAPAAFEAAAFAAGAVPWMLRRLLLGAQQARSNSLKTTPVPLSPEIVS